MNLEEQREPTDIDLSKATLVDLVKELKMRCDAVIVIMSVEDEEGEDTTVIHRLGSRFTVMGALEYAKIQIGTDQA